jgi:hypothetical protein
VFKVYPNTQTEQIRLTVTNVTETAFAAFGFNTEDITPVAKDNTMQKNGKLHTKSITSPPLPDA